MADDQRTIKIVLETKQAEKNTDKLGDSMKKAKGEAKGFSGVMTKQAGGMKAMATMALKLLGPLVSMAAAYKGLKAVMTTNLSLTIALDKATAGLGAVAHTITNDIGNLAAEWFNVGEGQTFASKTTQWVIDGLQALNQAVGTFSAELEVYNVRLQENIRIAEDYIDMQHDLKVISSATAIEIAKINTEYQKFRFLSRDESNDVIIRMKNFKLAQDALDRRFEAQQELQKERIALSQQFYDGTEKGSIQQEDALIKIQQEEVKLLQIETAYWTESRTLTRDGIRLKREYDEVMGFVVEDEERFDEVIKKSTLDVNAYAGALSIAAQANEMLSDSINSVTDANIENTDSQEGYNVTLQSSVGILSQMVNMFRNFNFSSLMSLIFMGLNIASNLVGGTGKFAGSFVGKLLGFRQGGIVQGPSHEQGGVRFNIGGVVNELEGGEGVINKQSMSIPWVKSLASQLNQIGGGVRFAQGGISTGPTALEAQTARLETLLKQRQIVAITEDIQTGLNTVQVQDNISSI